MAGKTTRIAAQLAAHPWVDYTDTILQRAPVNSTAREIPICGLQTYLSIDTETLRDDSSELCTIQECWAFEAFRYGLVFRYYILVKTNKQTEQNKIIHYLSASMSMSFFFSHINAKKKFFFQKNENFVFPILSPCNWLKC